MLIRTKKVFVTDAYIYRILGALDTGEHALVTYLGRRYAADWYEVEFDKEEIYDEHTDPSGQQISKMGKMAIVGGLTT